MSEKCPTCGRAGDRPPFIPREPLKLLALASVLMVVAAYFAYSFGVRDGSQQKKVEVRSER